MDTSTFASPAVVGFAKDFVFTRVDGSVDTALERQLGIGGHPTIILFKPDGKEVDRLFGYYAADSFMLEIKNYLAGINTLNDYLKRAAAAPNDPRLQYALGDKYTARARFDLARVHFGRVMELDPRNETKLADDAAYYLGFGSRKEKKWQAAIEDFRAMIKAYPESELREDAEEYIPYLYTQAGDSTQAVRYYLEFLKNFPASKETTWVREQVQKIEHPPAKK